MHKKLSKVTKISVDSLFLKKNSILSTYRDNFVVMKYSRNIEVLIAFIFTLLTVQEIQAGYRPDSSVGRALVRCASGPDSSPGVETFFTLSVVFFLTLGLVSYV